MKNLDNDARWDKFSFAQINQLKSFPPETLDIFLDLDEILFSPEEMKKIKSFVINFTDKTDSDKDFFKQMLSLLNTDSTKLYLNCIVSFTNSNPHYKASFLISRISPFIATKIKAGDKLLLEKLDFSKIKLENYYNFTKLTDLDVKSFNNLDCLYEIGPILDKDITAITKLLSLYPDKNISPLLIKLHKSYNPKEFLDTIKQLTDLTERENVDISFLSKYDPKEINEMLKRNSAFILKCIAHDIDFDYILKNYSDCIDNFDSVLGKGIDIKDFYKNGYSSEVIKAILGLRYRNLRQFEGIVLDFVKEGNNEEDTRLFVRFIQKTMPDNEVISLFKNYIKENDKETVKALINTYSLLLENATCKNPKKLFSIGNRIKTLETFCKYFNLQTDITEFDIEKVSQEFLWSAYDAYKSGFELENIFDEKFIKYDSLVYEALCIDAAGLNVPEKESEIIELYFETSNKEYESLLRLYKKDTGLVKLTIDDFKKLEYLINYNKTHKPVLIEDFINEDLSYLKDFLEGKDK